MMKTYSHIRRKALDEAAASLQPTFEFRGTMRPVRRSWRNNVTGFRGFGFGYVTGHVTV